MVISILNTESDVRCFSCRTNELSKVLNPFTRNRFKFVKQRREGRRSREVDRVSSSKFVSRDKLSLPICSASGVSRTQSFVSEVNFDKKALDEQAKWENLTTNCLLESS